MNDLRTAAQAVIDWIDADPKTKMLCSGCPEFVALRQALAETVEPVASCQGLLDSSRPSIDALIAEIEGIDGVSAPFATESDGLWVDADELKAILDKHRGVK